MDALGDYLKEAREKLNLSIEKISEDTRIMSKFIEAIEKEEFTVFPGEAYLIGFLKSYSEYLGIDGEDVVRRYERIKMAETPTPLEQLIPKPKFNPMPIIIITIVVLLFGGLCVGAFFGVKVLIATAKERKANEGNQEQIAETYQQKRAAKKEEAQKLTETTIIKEDITELTNPVTQLNKVKKDATIKLKINDKDFSVKVKQLSPTVVLEYANGKDLYVIKDTTHKIDLNSDGKNDLELVLNSWDSDFADFTFKTIDQTIVSTAKLGSYELIGENPEVLITKDAPEDINVLVTFKSQQFFRYKCDELPSVEKFYGNREDNKNLSIKAKSYLVVWFTYSDEATMSFPKFDNQVYNFQNNNRVEIRLIKWERNSEGKYELVVSSLK